MTLGVFTFVFTQRLLQGAGLPPSRGDIKGSASTEGLDRDCRSRRNHCLTRVPGPASLACAPAPVVTGLADKHLASFFYKGMILVGGLVLFLYATEPRKSGQQAAAAYEPFARGRLGTRTTVIVIFSLFSIVFWMGFEQWGNIINLFADKETNRVMFGYDVPGFGPSGRQPPVHHPVQRGRQPRERAPDEGEG